MVKIIRILVVIILQNVRIPFMIFTVSQPKYVTVLQKASNRKVKFRLEKLCGLPTTRGPYKAIYRPSQLFIPWHYRMENWPLFLLQLNFPVSSTCGDQRALIPSDSCSFKYAVLLSHCHSMCLIFLLENMAIMFAFFTLKHNTYDWS